jgi:hypothetical protein
LTFSGSPIYPFLNAHYSIFSVRKIFIELLTTISVEDVRRQSPSNADLTKQIYTDYRESSTRKYCLLERSNKRIINAMQRFSIIECGAGCQTSRAGNPPLHPSLYFPVPTPLLFSSYPHPRPSRSFLLPERPSPDVWASPLTGYFFACFIVKSRCCKNNFIAVLYRCGYIIEEYAEIDWFQTFPIITFFTFPQ